MNCTELNDLEAMQPIFSKEVLFRGETATDGVGVNRRLDFTIGTKSGKEPIEMVTAHGEGKARAETVSALALCCTVHRWILPKHVKRD